MRDGGGHQGARMLVLEQGGAESDGVVCAGVCAATKAGRYTIDGKAGFDLGSNNVTRSIVGSTEVLASRDAKWRRGARSQSRRKVAGNGGDLSEGKVATGEGDGRARAVEW